MRTICLSLFVIVGLLILGWAGPSRAQDCAKAAHSTTKPVKGVKAMSATTTDAMRKEFNASSDKVRIVALLSPSCPGCQSGHAVVGRVLKKFSSPELQALLVWEPMRSDDSRAAATQQAEKVRDARIWQGWNGNRNLGNLFERTLHLHETAWDVYLLYKPGIKWEGQDPPAPTFWMHQLTDANPNLLLCPDPTRLSVEGAKLLDNTAKIPHGD